VAAPVIDPDSEYLEYARECESLARSAQTQRDRERLLQMAREWMAVAMHEDKVPEPKSLPSE
jgi:hypothetical protein